MVVGYQHIKKPPVSTRMTFVVFRRPEDPKPTRIVARSVGSPWHVKGVAEVSRWSRLPIAKDGGMVVSTVQPATSPPGRQDSAIFGCHC